mgnify:FL=1|jgi:hypothetical protein|tara:strand:+ start:385 stop:657 length:273 start_codon:yes stop_codon:yes gene_type:complete
MKKTSDFLKKAIELVEGQRQEDYGDKTLNHQNIANLWNSYLGMDISPHDVAICMLLVKVARLKNMHTDDCYIDIAGYAGIAGEISKKETS